MKKENLKIANEIEAKIKDLDDHRRDVAYKITQAEKIDIRIRGDNNNYLSKLRPELSPVPFNTFIEAYYATIDAEIKKLELRLEML